MVKGGLDGGANIASAQLMKQLKTRGIDIHAVVSNKKFSDYLKSFGISCYLIRKTPFFTWPTFRNLHDFLISPLLLVYNVLWTLYATIQVVRISRNIGPHFIETCNSPTLYGYFAARITKIPHIWHLREYLGLNVLLHAIPCNRYLKDVLLKKSYTISITEDVALHFGCTNKSKDFVVTDGVLYEGETKYVADKDNYFLFVGMVDPSKGCDDMFEAYVSYYLQGGQNELWIVGKYEDNYQKILLSKLLDNNINLERVKFLGFRSDRFELMSKAQATIVPSPKEGFGFITVEALMNGCVVIGRDTGGTKMIMDSVGDGTLSFNSVDEMAKKMMLVSEKGVGSFRESIMESQEIAKRLYSIERCAQNVEEIYNKIKTSTLKK